MRSVSASRDIGPAESETLRMRGRSMPENREIPAVPVGGVRTRIPKWQAWAQAAKAKLDEMLEQVA